MGPGKLSYTPKGLYIGGAWVRGAAGKSLVSVNPANGERLAEVPWAGGEEVKLAVEAAKRGFAEWRRLPPWDRASQVEKLAGRIEEHQDELALMDSYDSGNTVSGMRSDVKATVVALKFFAGLAREMKGETLDTGANRLNYTLRQPFGVVAKINPFNHPFRFAAEKAAAPLVAGNSIIIKPPEQAPLSSLRFAELCEGLFPPGVVNVISGDAVAGAALVQHPDVRRIAFIGSVETGRIIAREAAREIKTVSLELGGKNPIIIFPDADVDRAVAAVLKGMNLNRQGQSCSSTSRVFVHEKLHDQVVKRLVEAAEAVKVGMPWEEGTEMGPVVSQEQFDRVIGYIDAGRLEGAALLTGGGRPKGREFERGYFIAPTVFDGVRSDMRIAREEIFGPLMSVLTWSDYERMLEEVNAVIYGLTAAIVTNDLKLAHQTAERVEAGYVWVNSAGHFLGAPYGGWKQSGIGREECLDELLSYTQVKNINVSW
jgi:betaine-aldehyde dehydrogenase